MAGSEIVAPDQASADRTATRRALPTTQIFWGVLLIAFIIVALVVVLFAPTSNSGFKDGASVLAFATLVAVGIERAIEVFWDLVGRARTLGEDFPFTLLKKQADTIESETRDLLEKVFPEVQQALNDSAKAAAAGSDAAVKIANALATVTAQTAQFDTSLKSVQEMAPGSARVAAASAIASTLSNSLGDALKTATVNTSTVQQVLTQARSAIQVAQSVIDNTSDNPVRRIASVLIGAMLGMLVVAVTGLNLFVAVLGTPGGNAPVTLVDGVFGVLISGIVVGLGSAPTHELIKALEQYKQTGSTTLGGSTTVG